ncbi:MAG: hypothetical protein LBD11_07985 [Candidatus Peribacteria bacterium]|jgi:hypothetical protein|nr:hypothetical protein [Candidatus Peribacteria bacterium]
MHTVAVLDRYTNKYLIVEAIPDEDFELIKVGNKLVYGLPDAKTGAIKNSVGIVIETVPIPKTSSRSVDGERGDKWLCVNYVRILKEQEKTDFDEQQQIALKIFPTFKKEFQAEYPNSVPITARFQIFSNQLYFFFYSEERYVFTEFVKRFREKLGMNMFLFQI